MANTPSNILFSTNNGTNVSFRIPTGNTGIAWGVGAVAMPILNSIHMNAPSGQTTLTINAVTAANSAILFTPNGNANSSTFISASGATNSPITGAAAGDLCFVGNSPSQLLFSGNNGTSIALKVATSNQVSAEMTTASTSTTTGALISKGGLGVAGAVFTGAAITTGTPAGGTAGAWKFGILVAGAVVVDATQYIQLDVGGTLYKLALAA